MSSSFKDATDRSRISDVRKAWIEAVVSGNPDQLLSLVTDDVIAVHSKGSCTCGKAELKKDVQHEFGVFDVERVVPTSEIIVHDDWAIEIDEVLSTRARVGDGIPVHTHFKAVFAFRRQLDGSWKIARILELMD